MEENIKYLKRLSKQLKSTPEIAYGGSGKPCILITREAVKEIADKLDKIVNDFK